MLKILIATPLYPPEIGGPATFTRFAEEELPKRGVEVAVEKFSDVRHLPNVLRHFAYFLRLLRTARRADVVLALDPLGIGLPAMLAAKLRGRRFLVRVAGDRAWETYIAQMQKSQPTPKASAGTAKLPPSLKLPPPPRLRWTGRRTSKNQNDNSKFKNVDEFQQERYGLGIELRRRIQWFVARKAERVIVPSEYLKRIVAMWGVPNEKIAVVYSSFETPKITETKAEARAALGFSGHIVVSAGRLVPWKGFSVLVEIMPQLQRDIPDARLVIIGDGPERETLRMQIVDCRMQDAVTLTGLLPQEGLHRYIRAADVFVLNSGYEGLSHQLLEAMALGTPVVASDIPGNRELIEDGQSGLLVDYNDRDAIRAAVVSLLQNEQHAHQLAEAAREKVAAFNGSRICENLVRIF
jgi:glycosyltransferase involved in cell wall biosynthesis